MGDGERWRRRLSAKDAKNHRELWVPVADALIQRLRTMQATSTSPLIFPAPLGGFLRHFHDHFRQAVKAAGLDSKVAPLPAPHLGQPIRRDVGGPAPPPAGGQLVEPQDGGAGGVGAPAASPHENPTADAPGAPKCVTDLLDSPLRARDCYTPAMADERPKTAYELAMERLAQKDKAAGGAAAPLTDEQKTAIAEARQLYQSRVAEREILHHAALRKAGTHEEVDQLNEALRRDVDRLATDRDRKIAQIRGEKPQAE